MPQKDLKLSDLKTGMLISGMQRRFDYQVQMRVEYVAYDWAVVRTESNHVFLLRGDETFSSPNPPEDQDA